MLHDQQERASFTSRSMWEASCSNLFQNEMLLILLGQLRRLTLKFGRRGRFPVLPVQ